MSQYPSDLTDAEWKQIEPIFDHFRFDEHDPRSLLNAVFYILKTGSQWRMLPKGFPPWQTVYYHFRKWRRLNLLQRLCDRIRRAARVAAGRRPSPSAAVIDTQSARAERQAGPGRGQDPNKKVKGRKRHVIVDTLGLLLAVVVHPANENDGQAAPSVLKRLLGKVPRLKVIFADSMQGAFRTGSFGGASTGFCRSWSRRRRAQASIHFRSGGQSNEHLAGLEGIDA